MKKTASILLSAALALNVTGVASAHGYQHHHKCDGHNHGEHAKAWNAVHQFEGQAVLTDGTKYMVQYNEHSGAVNVMVKKEDGNKKYVFTEKEAKERVAEFVKSLDLSTKLSKEEVVQRLSDALGIKPSDVEQVKANVKFGHHSHVALSYKKGENTDLHLNNIKDANVLLKGKDGYFYHVTYNMEENGQFHAVVEKKTADGKQVLKDQAALQELARVQEGLTPKAGTTLKAYIDQAAAVLGVQPEDVEQAKLDLNFDQGTKIHFDYKK
ncbi:YusW family protein [Falsibacillus albus]|uniref:Uncharacterized protein n=1 Tax=Falsibacillus albus TaxID=2478915 RepID=A0A3L7K3Q2_9BACI|nr:YusW family protein [Falsibacillus albus]RLQ96641.1 hypothetical protein D9X91_05930 [Falsibacillus albus]